jgi:hypothetical protein
LKKMMMLAALLAMLVVAAIPAIAQVEQPFEQEADSGDLEQESSTTGGGDNSIQCSGDLLQANTGNNQVENGVLQYASSGSPSPGGDNSLELSPEFEEDFVSCTADVNQAASAG